MPRDYLYRYQEGMEGILNVYFKVLVEHGVAPIIPQEILNKYIAINSENPRMLYDTLIKKANDECGKCRYRQGNDISLALEYTKSIERLIKDYIKKYVEEHFGYDLNRTVENIRPDYHFYVDCQRSVPESIICFLEADSTLEAIQNAISLAKPIHLKSNLHVHSKMPLPPRTTHTPWSQHIQKTR